MYVIQCFKVLSKFAHCALTSFVQVTISSDPTPGVHGVHTEQEHQLHQHDHSGVVSQYCDNPAECESDTRGGGNNSGSGHQYLTHCVISRLVVNPIL